MSDTLRIGCYGLNGHQIHVAVSTLRRAELTAVGAADSDEADKMVSALEGGAAGVERFTSLDDLLASGRVDLVSLCSERRDRQAAHTVQCLEAGCHVLAEKPLATTMDDLHAIAAAARRTGRRVFAMLPMVYGPGLVAMKQIIDRGDLGTVVHAYGLKSYPYHDNRPQDRGLDGGIMQAAIHALSFIHLLTGDTFSEVTAQDTLLGNPKRDRSPGDLQMAANLGLRLRGGGLVSVMANYLNRRELGYHGNDQVRVFGATGMVELVDGLTRRKLITEGGEPTTFDDVAPSTPYPQDIVDALLDGRPAWMSSALGVHCSAAAIAAMRSMEQGGVTQAVPTVG